MNILTQDSILQWPDFQQECLNLSIWLLYDHPPLLWGWIPIIGNQNKVGEGKVNLLTLRPWGRWKHLPEFFISPSLCYLDCFFPLTCRLALFDFSLCPLHYICHIGAPRLLSFPRQHFWTLEDQCGHPPKITTLKSPQLKTTWITYNNLTGAIERLDWGKAALMLSPSVINWLFKCTVCNVWAERVHASCQLPKWFHVHHDEIPFT